jgi:hypothetical protein
MLPEPTEPLSQTPRPEQGPLVIGWKEYVAFPDWPIRRVRVKVDTGARTSALDVAGYEVQDAENGAVAILRLALSRKHPERVTVVQAPVLGLVSVCNTGGVLERRPVIEATVRLGPVQKRIRLTLTSRAHMRFRMILGRQALLGSFIVDVSQKYLLRP